jgi:hypothetical protein
MRHPRHTVDIWTSVVSHGSEWTTETADSRSASDGMFSDGVCSHLCSSGRFSC